jgi:hypothetical protein
VFFGQDAVQPGEGAAGFAAECAFGLGAFLAREGAGCDSFGLVVDKEKGDEESVDDIAVEAEGFLFAGGARVSMAGAEAWSFHAAFLATELFTHYSEGFIAL